jgi:DNA helicase II / ATP-dependent DNA helicase PcrA
VRLLRRDGEPLAQIRPGFTRRFSIYDDEDQLALIKAAIAIWASTRSSCNTARRSRASASAKNQKQTPQDFYRDAKDPAAGKLAVIWDEYEKALHTANALDFDDLLLETVRLLYHDDATRAQYNRRISYMMIDEYQDTNRSQYELMRLLTETHGNVCVVGDEDQSIYSWRGADIKNILDFEHDFPKARAIRLEQNYRSTKNILAAAGTVVANNKARKGKTLWTEADRGEMLGMYGGWDAENEGMFIAKTIERLLAENPKDRVAVLYRTNSQSRQIEEALRRHGRKYLVVGGFSFYQRAEIKDAVAYLKLAMSNQDSVSLLRVINTPARGIGRTTVDQVDAFARDNELSLWDAVSRMIDQQCFRRARSRRWWRSAP